MLATDADFGDVLAYELASAPAGMTIDTVTGLVSWLPSESDTGAHSVVVAVTDTLGFAAVQPYTLTVGFPVIVPDVVTDPREAAEATITGANLLVGAVTEINHATAAVDTVVYQAPPAGAVAEFGAEVDLTVSLGPSAHQVDDDGDGFSEEDGDCDDTNGAIAPGAADPGGDGIDQNCDGLDGELANDHIVVEPANELLLVGQVIGYSATAVLIDGTSQNSQNVTGLVSWQSPDPAASITSGGRASADAPGAATSQATLNGVTGAATLNVVSVVAGDDMPLLADIASPGSIDTVTAPIGITGSATDTNFLKYVLEIAPAGDSTFTEIATITTPVAGGVLGQLDPTLLLNDLYRVRLTVFDQGGNQSVDEVVVQVDENMQDLPRRHHGEHVL